jgi:hypothetical protein
VNKSRQLLQVKEREKQHETIHIEDTHIERLVTEIEMLKVVLHLVVARGQKKVKVSFSRWVLVKKPAGFSMTKNDNERLQLEEDVNSLVLYLQPCTGA